MISLEDITRRLQLENAFSVIRQYDFLMDLADGLWLPANGEIMPLAVSKQQKQAFERVKKQLASHGPRVMRRKLDAVLGTVTWGGTDDELDDGLRRLDIRSIARRLLKQYVVTGITAAVVLPDLDVNTQAPATVRRLGGFLQAIPHGDDVDQVVGLYRVASKTFIRSSGVLRKRETNALRYDVEVWDWEFDAPDRSTYRIWRNLLDPTRLGAPPSEITMDAPRPRFRIDQRTSDGYAIGELEQLSPSLLALMANEARQFRAEETTAMPMLKIIGSDVPDGFTIGPDQPLPLDQGADAEWMPVGSLDELRQQHKIRSERVRQDGSLPGGFLGNDSPSGEALIEANLSFRQNTGSYAVDMSGLMSELAEDVATLIGVTPQPVSVTPSKEYDLLKRVMTTLELYRERVIPLEVAVEAVKEFFPFWSDKDANAWVKRQSMVLDPEGVAALLGNPTPPDPESPLDATPTPTPSASEPAV